MKGQFWCATLWRKPLILAVSPQHIGEDVTSYIKFALTCPSKQECWDSVRVQQQVFPGR